MSQATTGTKQIQAAGYVAVLDYAVPAGFSDSAHGVLELRGRLLAKNPDYDEEQLDIGPASAAVMQRLNRGYWKFEVRESREGVWLTEDEFFEVFAGEIL